MKPDLKNFIFIKKCGTISAVLALLMLVNSCMSIPMDGNIESEGQDRIEGIVTDMSGNVIEHIKVTFDWNQGQYQEIKYTDSYGQFSAELWSPQTRESISLAITLEDIDGTENGGLFESQTDNVTLFDNDGSLSIEPLVYRLNRATASENNPRS